jgi:hypothetical protein
LRAKQSFHRRHAGGGKARISPEGAGERPEGLILKARKTPRDQRELNPHGVCIRILKDTPTKLLHPRPPVKPGRDAMTSHPLSLCLSQPPTANTSRLRRAGRDASATRPPRIGRPPLVRDHRPFPNRSCWSPSRRHVSIMPIPYVKGLKLALRWPALYKTAS